jgi:glycosyltransferase involved in cell wall biosynthesis
MSSNKYYPLVSIVIPVYNGARYLKYSVQSILEQDYPNIELLVLDDGSTDNTVDILKNYGSSVFWETHENMGQAATLNKGWEMAEGEILSYLSVDDLLEPNAVSASIEYLLANPDIIMTYGDYALIDDNNNLIRNVVAPEFNYSDLLAKVIIQPGPGIFFRREGFLKIGGWDTALRQMPDLDYWLRLGLLGSFARIPLSLASFRVHEDSQTFTESSKEKSEECLQVMNKYFSNVQLPSYLRTLEGAAYSSAHIIAARLHIRAGRYILGCQYLFNAYGKDKKTLLSLRTLKLVLNAIKYRIQKLLSF